MAVVDAEALQIMHLSSELMASQDRVPAPA